MKPKQNNSDGRAHDSFKTVILKGTQRSAIQRANTMIHSRSFSVLPFAFRFRSLIFKRRVAFDSHVKVIITSV